MATIHENIDAYLAADLHRELSESEREELHTHLMECAECRAHYKEEQLTHKVLQATLESAKPALGFEQRMLASFRNRVPNRNPRLSSLFVNVGRLRLIQAAGAAIVFFALVQVGRVLTGDIAVNFPLLGGPSRPEYASEVLGARREAVTSETESQSKSLDTITSKEKQQPAQEVAGSAIPTAAEVGPSVAPSPESPPVAVTNDRKLIRNANVDLEVKSFDEALRSITAVASEGRGYVATTSSQKQENGKLRGQIIVKILPDNLDGFLGKLRNLGELKNQTLATEDVTKAYVDSDARLRNSRLVEKRLLDLLDKNAGRVADLLEVEKELGRVREQIEQLQGELKSMDMQVQFATVTISLAEKDLETPARFLLKEHAQLSLFAADVEKSYSAVKGLASPSVQIAKAILDRNGSGQITARISILIAPENADDVITKIKALGRVENYQLQSERVARGGEGMSQEATTQRDKVELNVTITQQDQEAALQQTSLSIRASDVTEQSRKIRDLAAKHSGSIRSSSFSRDPNGREYANVAVRVPLQNYNAFTQSLSSLGRLENLAVHRTDRPTQFDEKTAPADVTIQVYSQGNVVAEGSGLAATMRSTIAQGAGALMWSVRMIGVAMAFLAPWIIAFGAFIGIVTGIRRSRRHRQR
jgi:Domain of unknown function (DUF4349)/Putative zinc-finger